MHRNLLEVKMSGLRKTNGVIVKIRSRDRSGKLMHKNEFSLDDSKRVENELRVWKDKFGVPVKVFNDVVSGVNQEDFDDLRGLMKRRAEESREKVKRSMS